MVREAEEGQVRRRRRRRSAADVESPRSPRPRSSTELSREQNSSPSSLSSTSSSSSSSTTSSSSQSSSSTSESESHSSDDQVRKKQQRNKKKRDKRRVADTKSSHKRSSGKDSKEDGEIVEEEEEGEAAQGKNIVQAEESEESEAEHPTPNEIENEEVEEKARINQLSIVTEVLVRNGLELAYGKEGELIVQDLDPDEFAEYDVAIGDKVVYVGDYGTRHQPDLDRALEILLANAQDGIPVGLERTMEKKSNLLYTSRVEADSKAKQAFSWGVGIEDEPSAATNKMQSGAGNSRRKRKRITLPKESKLSAAKRSDDFRRPPVPFSQSWELYMRSTEYAQPQRKVWVVDETDGFRSATLLDCYRTSVRIALLEGARAGEELILPVNKVVAHYSEDEYSDSTSADDVCNLPTILERMRRQFTRNKQVFFWMAKNTILSINPCEEIEGLFVKPATKTNRKAKEHADWKDNNAHLFQLVDQAYSNATSTDASQTILVTGVSGAGKTRNAREMVQYLLDSKPCAGISVPKLRAKLVACGILLQAFGSASTVRCGDATCFHKLTRVHLQNGKVCNLTFEKHGLALERLVRHSRFERNFHIFYQICNGWKKSVKLSKDVRLLDASAFRMLGFDKLSYRKITRPHDTRNAKFPLTSGEGLKRTLQALDVLGINEAVREDILRILAAILYLSNVNFAPNTQWNTEGDRLSGITAGPNATPAKTIIALDDESEEYLGKACVLLQVTREDLARTFLFKLRPSHARRNSPIPLGTKRASNVRDFFIKHLYSLVFDLLLKIMNSAFTSADPLSTTSSHSSSTSGSSASSSMSSSSSSSIDEDGSPSNASRVLINVLELAGFNFPFAPHPITASSASSAASNVPSSESATLSQDPVESSPSPKTDVMKQQDQHEQDSTPKVALISSGMIGAAESHPGNMQLLSFDALFQNYTNEVLEQSFQRLIVDAEHKRITQLTESQQADSDQHLLRIKRALVRGRSSILELMVGLPSGVFPALDQQSLLRGVRPNKDAEFVIQLNSVHESKKLYQRAMFGYNSFKIKHFGGELLDYSAQGMVSQNSRTISYVTQFYHLFDKQTSPVLALLAPVAKVQKEAEEYGLKKLNQHSEAHTLSQIRRREVVTLAEIVEDTQVSFVRCILPNVLCQPATWHGANVVKQLAYSGVRQVCAARDAFFPIVYTETEFLDKFSPTFRRILLDGPHSARAFLTVLLGEEFENALWRTCLQQREPQANGSRRPAEEEACFMLSLRANRVLERTRWKTREKSALQIQHGMMQFLERVNAALIIQHFVYKFIIDPNYLRHAALRILNAFRMFHVRNDYLIIRRAAIRIQSLVRLYLCRNWDMRVNDVVVRIQKVWRGQAIRRRFKMLKLCRIHSSPDPTLRKSFVYRSSLVLQTSVDTFISKPSKRKRQLVITAGPVPEMILLDPHSTKKCLWRIPWGQDLRAKGDEKSSWDSFFSVERKTEQGSKTVSYCDILEQSDNKAWARDVNSRMGLSEMLCFDTSFKELANRFFAAYFLSGNLYLQFEKNQRAQWKDRFFFLHQRKLYCFKGDQVLEIVPINSTTVVHALNTFSGSDGNFVEILPEDDEDERILLKASSREDRDRWIQGISWVISISQSLSRAESISSERPRSGTIATHAIAISTIRSSGNFSALNVSQASYLQSKRRSDSLQRGISKILGSGDVESKAHSKQLALDSGAPQEMGSAEDAEDTFNFSEDNTGGSPSHSASDGDDPSYASEEQMKAQRLRQEERKRRQYAKVKRRILDARVSNSLFHLISTPEYIQEHAPRAELKARQDEFGYRKASVVKLSVGKVEDALNCFLQGSQYMNGSLSTYESERLNEAENLNSLLVFSEIKTLESRRHRRKRLLASFSSSAGADDGLDSDALEQDKEGKLLASLLENLNLSQYISRFKNEGLTSIRQAKCLSHEDLLELNVDSFSHRERMLDAFQNYAKTGSSLEQPKRNSLRVEELFQQVQVLSRLLEDQGVKEHLLVFVDNNCTNLTEIKQLSSKQFKKLGISDTHRALILEAVDAELEKRKAAIDEAAAFVPGSSLHDLSKGGDSASKTSSSSSGSASGARLGEGASCKAEGNSSSRSSGDKGESDRSSAAGDSSSGSLEGGGGILDSDEKRHSRRLTIKFADQIDWTCTVCRQRNESEVSRCSRCAARPPAQCKRLEKVRKLEECVPWKCQTCLSMNAYNVFFCSWCNTRKTQEETYETEFAVADRVKLIVSEVYQLPKGSTGTVVDVDVVNAVCQVQFDDGSFLRVSNDDLRKPEKFRLARLFQYLPSLSPTSRLSSAFH